MRSYPTRFVILFLLVTLLLAACGDATSTVGPAALPTATQPVTTTVASTIQATPTATPVPNQQITPAPGQLPTKASQPATTPAKSTTANPATPTPFVNTDATPVAINIGQSFKIQLNQTAYLPTNDLYISFTSVTEESRCPNANGPKSVECFWAGQVTVQLRVSQADKAVETVKLTLPGATSQTGVPASATLKLGNNQLQLLTVDPHPVIDVTINRYDYVVTLLVV